ncbi:MAG: hypothetical protein A3G44_17270 [Candidatus Rokubacteria bacterium RIFCSPLOWO2_12_FULL_73_47]|nr:MAG: hypothetical protein A3G44_17270 [Candidatus Rokubacteria bacterium RIFCSPLOWO2_12_FULL_73_47]
MAFIDLMNLYESLGQQGLNTNLDYYRFSCKMAEPHRRLIRCHVYTGAYDQTREPDRYGKQVAFFNRVHRMPFVTLKTRPLLSRGGTYIQKGVDTLIATDMVSMAFLNHYDIALLVSGDGDLAPAVEAVKAAGKQIVVAAFPRSRSTAIGNAADYEIVLNAAYLQECYHDHIARHDNKPDWKFDADGGTGRSSEGLVVPRLVSRPDDPSASRESERSPRRG